MSVTFRRLSLCVPNILSCCRIDGVAEDTDLIKTMAHEAHQVTCVQHLTHAGAPSTFRHHVTLVQMSSLHVLMSCKGQVAISQHMLMIPRALQGVQVSAIPVGFWVPNLTTRSRTQPNYSNSDPTTQSNLRLVVHHF